ncbi:MAG: helix-turn-helix domain-containing protein [Janthinobacterium lividum]
MPDVMEGRPEPDTEGGLGAVRRWSTDDVPPGERLTYWIEAVCEAFFELRVDSSAGRDFTGTVDLCELGPLGMLFLRSDDQHVERTPHQVARSVTGRYQLVQFRNSHGRVRQFGREVIVDPGGCTLIDSRHPFTLDNKSDQDALSIALPVDWVESRVRNPEDAIARHWRAGDGWSGVLGATLARLAPAHGGGLSLPSSVASDQIGSLLALAVGQPGVSPVHEAAGQDLLRHVRDTIRGSCQDTALNAENVAACHGLSSADLHLRLAIDGSSFDAEVTACRLEGARRMLADRRFDDLSIADVALRWGFAPTDRFVARFRRRFDLAPSWFRKAMRF